jgi:hypothetical protein
MVCLADSLFTCTPKTKLGVFFFPLLIYFENSNQKMEFVEANHGSNNLKGRTRSSMFCTSLCYSFVLFTCFHDTFVFLSSSPLLLAMLNVGYCCNPNLGFMTKLRAHKGVNQEWSPKVTFHALRSVRECEGMNPHTPKCVRTLGIKVPMDFQIFKRRFQMSKLIGLKSSLLFIRRLNFNLEHIK